MHETLTQIEELSKTQVEKVFGQGLWAEYIVAREKVFDKLLPHIRQNEPFLTDHGPDHITNVFNNAYELLEKNQCVGKDSTKSLEAAELYLLVISILFHDVGNIFSRTNHQARLTEAYAFAKGTDQSLTQERRLLFTIVEAHGGTTNEGSHDTIRPLERNGIFRGKRVDCQRVAAILRFADELAEGPQRTSLFMQEFLQVPVGSEMFHDFATITNIHISRADERIAVVYDIEVVPALWGNQFNKVRLTRLLEFCFYRLHKLDLERKYNRHYCSLLQRFKKTEASFHFYCRGVEIRLDLPTLVLNDLVLPNRIEPGEIAERLPEFDLTVLVTRIGDACQANAHSNQTITTSYDAH